MAEERGYRLVEEARLPWPSLPLEDYAPVAARILRRGGVDEPADPSSRRGVRVLAALKLIGVSRIPVGGRPGLLLTLEELGLYEEYERPRGGRVYGSALEMLRGDWPTPLVRSSALSGGDPVYLKLEYLNPFSLSVKDRAAWYMLERALGDGLRLDTLCEASSGNTGIALAALAAVHGLAACIVVPSGVRREVISYLEALGAEVLESDKPLTVEALEEVEEVARRRGGVHLNQFYNDANFAVHVRYTGRELDYQLRSIGLRPSTLVAGVGTSGHLGGTAFYLKNRYPGLKVVAVQPAPGDKIPGLRRMETGMKWLRYAEPDVVVDVGLEEAMEAVKLIARRDGILVSPSAGAAAAAYLREGSGPAVVVVPDTGFKYPSLFPGRHR